MATAVSIQKFHKGDLVHIAKNLGSYMSHFTADCKAIVMGSYADQFGGDHHDSYTLYIQGKGEVSWYEERQLTLVTPHQMDILRKWQDEDAAEDKEKGDLDWIFANGPAVLKSATGATADALGGCLGVTSLWGSHGEGFTYYANALRLLAMAKPFLEKNDKAGWLEFCKAHKS